MISIIIPAFKEPFMQKTIDSILKSARGNVEILPVFDGRSPDKPIKPDSRVKVIMLKKHMGMRAAINAGISQAKGKFIMKCDAHCAFGAGFDKILSENCAEDWVVVPRRYSLDDSKWQRNKNRPYRDYNFIVYPTPNHNKIYGISMSNSDWTERTEQRQDPKYDIDDNMTFQGSCWMAQKNHFLKQVGFLDDRSETYGPFADEYLEIGLKYWLKGSQVKIIKKTWYAHLTKMKRHYQAGLFTKKHKNNLAKNRTWASKHWMNNEEQGLINPISWLIEKFWPVPTWPEDRSKWVFSY
ncbi:MAG: hypothetical protein A3G15_02180 [Candidatus Levybacteria bacterium RIFCSPLOWO2_12_FULL_40_10]|nr:MAG: hypothetical protein A3G15_02180 [Candidatus Levybacteria bacterium RIFCSPLOWO2_12_FULL_40_10]